MSAPIWPLVAAAVAGLDNPALPRSLAALLRHVAPFSYAVMFAYQGTNPPLDVYDDFPPNKRKIFVTDYQAGPYLLDPFFLAATQPVAAGLYRLRDLAPDRFYQGEYYRNYYAQTGLAEEIAYFVDLPGKAILVLSLMRAEKPFTQREYRALQALFPFVAAIAARHWAGLSLQFRTDQRPKAAGRQRRAIAHGLGRFGDGILTPREREVAEFTLQGHSAESTGQILGIAAGTVRIHRRNIYSKLNINSQGELFSRFLGTLVDAS